MRVLAIEGDGDPRVNILETLDADERAAIGAEAEIVNLSSWIRSTFCADRAFQLDVDFLPQALSQAVSDMLQLGG